MEVKPDPLRWQYRQEWCAWWLVQNDGEMFARGYGPFNETEAVWAGEVHGVPFAHKDTE